MFDDFDTQICPEEFEDDFIEDDFIEDENGWIEFEPGKFIYDEMSANP